MTVKFILRKCLEKMNVADFTEKSSLTDSETNMREGLLSALNAVYREIIADYTPLIASETVTPRGGKINAASLNKQILYPIKVEQGSRQLDFATDAENVIVECEGSVKLTYAYIPTTALGMNDSVNVFNASDSLLSDGVLAQYFLSVGLYDLAKSYDAVYRDRLWRLRYKNKGMLLKERRWTK